MVSAADAEQTFAKSQLGGNTYDTKILGVIWDKKGIKLRYHSSQRDQVTSRGILEKLASINNPLDVASPVTQYRKEVT